MMTACPNCGSGLLLRRSMWTDSVPQDGHAIEVYTCGGIYRWGSDAGPIAVCPRPVPQPTGETAFPLGSVGNEDS